MNEIHMKKIRQFVLCLFLLIIGVPRISVSAAESYQEQVILITKDNQVADSFCGIDAEYITTYSDVGTYSCAGYVKKFYMALFNANVYQINMYDGPPLVTMEGHDVRLKQVKKPIPGDIMQNTGRTHVGIVKHVSGDTVTLIEQNYKWNLNGNIYARINRKISAGSAYFYRLVVDGKEVTIDNKGDYTPQDYEQWKVSDLSGINVRAGAGTRYDKLGAIGYATTFYVYEKLEADGYTWGKIQYNGQDGYVALEFATYVTGSIGKDTEPPVISEVRVHGINAKGYKITCKIQDNRGLDRVQFPTWSKINGQDDLPQDWGINSTYSGQISGDTVTFQVSIRDHNNDKGKYYTHIYAYDKAGNVATYVIDTIHTGFENLGDVIYCKLGTEKGTYVTNDGGNITARTLYGAENDSSRQIWKCVRNADGSYQIVSLSDGKAAYVKNASGVNGTNILPYTAGNSKGQKWYFYKEGNKYRLGAACTDGYMTLNGNSSADGTNIKITIAASKTGQRIKLLQLPGESEILKAEPTEQQGVKLTLQKAENVKQYVIYRLDKKTGSYRQIGMIPKGQALEFTDSNCAAGYTYTYRVKTVMTLPEGTEVFSGYSDAKSATAQLDKGVIKKATKKTSGVQLQWGKIEGAKGYEIYRKAGSNGKYYKIKTLYSATRRSYTDTGIKPGKKYYYKLRAYGKVNGKIIYGDYSAAYKFLQ